MDSSNCGQEADLVKKKKKKKRKSKGRYAVDLTGEETQASNLGISHGFISA